MLDVSIGGNRTTLPESSDASLNGDVHRVREERELLVFHQGAPLNVGKVSEIALPGTAALFHPYSRTGNMGGRVSHIFFSLSLVRHLPVPYFINPLKVRVYERLIGRRG